MRDPHLPLTETVAYTLLALVEPGHGYAVMARVESMSDGAVRLAPGTMYGALENLEKQKLIARMASADARRKVYQITELGYQTLTRDAERMAHLVSLFELTRTQAPQKEER
ncbi:PadR family transcriptional regulator [Herbiconiux sp. SALV-R1]|nr:PadR family transcriptional regulator [Herbiconiux sp. SALV-R1]